MSTKDIEEIAREVINAAAGGQPKESEPDREPWVAAAIRDAAGVRRIAESTKIDEALLRRLQLFESSQTEFLYQKTYEAAVSMRAAAFELLNLRGDYYQTLAELCSAQLELGRCQRAVATATREAAELAEHASGVRAASNQHAQLSATASTTNTTFYSEAEITAAGDRAKRIAIANNEPYGDRAGLEGWTKDSAIRAEKRAKLDCESAVVAWQASQNTEQAQAQRLERQATFVAASVAGTFPTDLAIPNPPVLPALDADLQEASKRTSRIQDVMGKAGRDFEARLGSLTLRYATERQVVRIMALALVSSIRVVPPYRRAVEGEVLFALEELARDEASSLGALADNVFEALAELDLTFTRMTANLSKGELGGIVGIKPDGARLAGTVKLEREGLEGATLLRGIRIASRGKELLRDVRIRCDRVAEEIVVPVVLPHSSNGLQAVALPPKLWNGEANSTWTVSAQADHEDAEVIFLAAFDHPAID